MAKILLFHHVLGRTEGVHAFADELRSEGHAVHLPDLFDGRVFASIEEGLAYVEQIGFEKIVNRGVEAAEGLPRETVYAGFSLGVVAAQRLAQTRERARGALFFDACVPTSMFGSPWPEDLPVQIHGMAEDPYFVEEGDIDAARELSASAKHAELFLYPGDRHLFADSSLPSYDAEAAKLALQRALEFLRQLDS
ncbi:dienelactone hydrolase family protein [Cohnella thailandensis]|uniref:Dienelactone hydrolase family protein n=1 Tax=Cohnella thailandensis TaxID=557557 RepID=A0A841SQE0_9BACL|nr:dienelactone hydrolase family protein [Cohnella thailandensis]MBB6633079.1 dienelactone hydrolase family protein [Cohnella thailandensis]MBP1975226.1 dienelactone hydrolase [Cohnella thailandensis]